MPLKLAAVLQRSKDHPEQINDDIINYHEWTTRGNRYVLLYMKEHPLHNFEKRLQNYVKEMGFDDSSIILVDKEWDVKPEEEEVAHIDLEARAQPWAEVAFNAAVGEAIWAGN